MSILQKSTNDGKQKPLQCHQVRISNPNDFYSITFGQLSKFINKRLPQFEFSNPKLFPTKRNPLALPPRNTLSCIQAEASGGAGGTFERQETFTLNL